MDQFLKQFENKPKNTKPLGQYVMKFGKHKNKTYKTIYEEDPDYVKWIVTTKDDTYIKRIKEYCMSRIQTEYPPQV